MGFSPVFPALQILHQYRVQQAFMPAIQLAKNHRALACKTLRQPRVEQAFMPAFQPENLGL